MALEYSPGVLSGFPWQASGSGSPSLARSNLASAVPHQLLNLKAFGVPVVPSQPANWHWPLRTCQCDGPSDSRANEISSAPAAGFQPLLLGSHDEIIMHVHGTVTSV